MTSLDEFRRNIQATSKKMETPLRDLRLSLARVQFRDCGTLGLMRCLRMRMAKTVPAVATVRFVDTDCCDHRHRHLTDLRTQGLVVSAHSRHH